MSIQSRIAALNLEQVGHAPPSARPAPPHAPRQHSASRLPASTSNLTNEPAHTSPPPVVVRATPPPPPRSAGTSLAPRPAGPSLAPPPPPRSLAPRSSSAAKPAPPPLPRRSSNTSVCSSVSARSAASAATSVSAEGEARVVKAPAFDPGALPVLPPKRSKEEREMMLANAVGKKRPALPGRGSSGVGSAGARVQSGAARVQSGGARVNVLGGGQGQEDAAPRRLPPTFDAQRLPALPPPRVQQQEEMPVEDVESTVVPLSTIAPSPSAAVAVPSNPTVPSRPAARPVRSALSFGMNKKTQQAPDIPIRPGSVSENVSSTPPPIPTSSRPDLTALLASKPRFDAAPTSAQAPTPAAAAGVCLKCRDFSAPDAHAARFPRQAIPSQDVHWLARALTSPFPSPTDKARAIFAWMHHNIAYNCEAFFSGNIRASDPSSTISSGLAVCSGYAGLYAALCVAAGVPCIVAGGHGKGYGYTHGTPCPREPSGHAWNAVQIDNGEWKLVDPCWGAGTVGEQRYTPGFNPGEFTKTNAEFGRTHFPSDPAHFYLPPGQRLPTFAEYWTGALDGLPGGGARVAFYGHPDVEHGLDPRAIVPHARDIATRPGVLRFELWSVCEHWDNVRHGRGQMYQLVLLTHGRGGAHEDMRVFETDGRRRWWLDVDAQELGRPGQALMCGYVETVDGRDARGMGRDELLAAKGRKGMSFGGVCGWELV